MMTLQKGDVVAYKQYPRNPADVRLPAKVVGAVSAPLGDAWELELEDGGIVTAYETQIVGFAGEVQEDDGDWDALSKTAVALLGQLGVLAVRVTVKGEISGDILVDRDHMGEFVRQLRRLQTGGSKCGCATD